MSQEEIAPEPKDSAAETDERFPSGPWTGFWLQRGLTGRQWMRDLNLRFADGLVEGSGVDCVGPFDLRGHYDLETGQCSMRKTYLDAHSVYYEGRNDDDGLWIWGTWRLALDRGGFHIWPKGVDDPTQRRLHAEQDLPVEELEAAAV